jgi:hypothetical protein
MLSPPFTDYHLLLTDFGNQEPILSESHAFPKKFLILLPSLQNRDRCHGLSPYRLLLHGDFAFVLVPGAILICFFMCL